MNNNRIFLLYWGDARKVGSDLGEPTHTLIPCWMTKSLPPRNECTSCFTPTGRKHACHSLEEKVNLHFELSISTPSLPTSKFDDF